MLSLALRIVGGAVILTMVQIGGGMLQGVVAPSTLPQMPPNMLPWLVAANLLYVFVLTWIAYVSRERDWRLAVTLFLVLYGICHFNSIVEARFFGLFDSVATLVHLAVNLIEVAVFAPMLVLLLRGALGEPSAEPSAYNARLTVLRLFIGGVMYLVTYFGAGILVFPYVRDFYATKPMPNGLVLIAWQALFRGPVFVTILFLAIRAARGRRAETLLLSGATLSILGGVGLIVPNPYMPDPVRLAHLVEVCTSNFVYGMFVGWLLTREKHATDPMPSHAAASV